MIHFKANLEIRQPLERVFAAFMDRAQWPRWRSGLRSVKTLEGDLGKPGSKQRLIFLHKGQEMAVDETVIDAVENEACYFRLDYASMYSLTNVVFSERAGKTRVSSAVQVYGSGLRGRLLVAFLKGSLRRHQKADLVRFKALLEGAP